MDVPGAEAPRPWTEPIQPPDRAVVRLATSDKLMNFLAILSPRETRHVPLREG
jgi:hypothetical protein